MKTIIPPGSGIAGILPVSSPSPLSFTTGGECRRTPMPRFSPSLSVSVTITILVAAVAGPLRGRVPSGVWHLLKIHQREIKCKTSQNLTFRLITAIKEQAKWLPICWHFKETRLEQVLKTFGEQFYHNQV